MNFETMRQLEADIQALGGELPPELATIRATIQSLSTIPVEVDDPTDKLRDGRANPDNIAEIVADITDQLGRMDGNGNVTGTRDAIHVAGRVLGDTYARLLKTTAGDAIVESVSTTVTEAMTSMRKCAAHVAPGNKPEWVLEAGKSAVEAWHAMPKHAATLDRYARILSHLATDGYDAMVFDSSNAHKAAYFAADDVDSGQLDNLGRALDAADANRRGYRGGIWHKLVLTNGVSLAPRTPGDAKALLDRLIREGRGQAIKEFTSTVEMFEEE